MLVWFLQQDPWYWDHHHGWESGWWMLVGGGVWLVFLVIIIAGVMLLLRPSQQMRASEARDSALEIVRRRYAQGEISREEFETLRQDPQR